MRSEYLEKAQYYNQQRIPYATAVIVKRTIPTSGKPGDKAIILSDGTIHGWIGGGCTRGIVLKEAIESMQEGKPRYVSISPDSNALSDAHTKIYKMTCQSGGEVDVYIEPVLPKPQLAIFGKSHIGMALSKIARALDYEVVAINKGADKNVYPNANRLIELDQLQKNDLNKSSYIIVCTQGEGDQQALRAAVQLDAPYLAFVASRKKAQHLFTDLRQAGVTMDQLKTIKTPAGLDINAKLPEEVAISILAEIIKDYRNPTEENPSTTPTNLGEDYYINPVCQIPVQKSTAKHILEYKNEKVYFCCDGCKVQFEAAPEKFIA